MKIYIAGPMRDNEKAKYKHYNFDEFDRIEFMLIAQGHKVVSPAKIDRLFEGWDKYPPEGFITTKEDAARFLQRDLNAIQGCDAIFLMQNWSYSKGVELELAYAHALGLTILYEDCS